MSSDDDIKNVVVPKGLYQIISDMVKDIVLTFPEEKETLNSDLQYIINLSVFKILFFCNYCI